MVLVIKANCLNIFLILLVYKVYTSFKDYANVFIDLINIIIYKELTLHMTDKCYTYTKKEVIWLVRKSCK